jgi:hypothetical protein
MFQLEGAVDDLWEKRIAVMGSEPYLNSLLIQLKSVLQVGGAPRFSPGRFAGF